MPRSKKSKTKNGGANGTRPQVRRSWTHVPRLVVFDLDFTFWHPEMYELYGAPFKKNPHTGAVTDRSGEQVHFFPAVHSVLSILQTDPQFSDTEVAVASSTTEPQWARTCMRLMDVDVVSGGGGARGSGDENEDGEDTSSGDDQVQCTKKSLQSIIDYQAIYPRNKRVHFKQLKDESGVEYEDMLFFDNEYGNIHNVGGLGVVCSYCPQGLSDGSWIQGMEAFQQSKSAATH